MDKFEIRVNGAEEVCYFEVHILLDEKCAYKVYQHGELVAVFEPDEEEDLHVCENPGRLDEEVIYQIGLKIEAHTV